MSKANYRTQTDVDKKSTLIGNIVAIVIWVGFFFCNYVFDTILKEEMQQAEWGWHLGSIIGYLVSLAGVLNGEKISHWFGERVSGAGVAISAAILLALSVGASGGFDF